MYLLEGLVTGTGRWFFVNPSTSPPLEADEGDAFEISGTGSSNSELQIENPAIIRRRRIKRRRERGIMKRRGIEKGVLEEKWGMEC